MGLWPGCTESGSDFSCGIHFNIKEYRHVPIPFGLSDLDKKIKHGDHAKYFTQKISEVFMRSFGDKILKRNPFSWRMLSRIAGADRDQDQESTSARHTFTSAEFKPRILT